MLASLTTGTRKPPEKFEKFEKFALRAGVGLSRRRIVAILSAGSLALSSVAAAQEQKPPIAFAEAGTVTVICGDAAKGRQSVEVLNDTATTQTVELHLSQLRDQNGKTQDGAAVCGGVSVTLSLTIEPGLSGVAAVTAGKPPAAGSAVYSGTIAAFTPAGPVVRRAVVVREATAATVAKPLASTVSATLYRWRPWGEEEIEVPVRVAPDKALSLTDDDVVGGLAGDGDSGVVTYAGKHKQSDKTTNVELAVAGLGPGSYEGDLDLVPAADEGKVTLKLTVKDWWPLAALAVLGGILIGLAVQRFLNVTLPKTRLLNRVDDAETQHKEATRRLANDAKNAGDKPWGAFALGDLATRLGALRRQIRRETRPYYLNLDAKVIEALETKIKALEDEIDQLNTVHEKMSSLEQSLDAVKVQPIANLPLRDEDKKRGEPLLTQRARDLLKGARLSLTQLGKRLTDAKAATTAAADMTLRLQQITYYFDELKKLNKKANADLKKEVETVLNSLEATTWKLWNTPDATRYTELAPATELDAIYNSIADLVAKHQIPPLPELVFGGGGPRTETLGMRPLHDDEDLVAAEEEIADEEAKKTRWHGYGVAAIAAIVALITALHVLYIDKAFGTGWDYVWATTWGLTTQAVLVTLTTAIGGIAGLRALGQRVSRA